MRVLQLLFTQKSSSPQPPPPLFACARKQTKSLFRTGINYLSVFLAPTPNCTALAGYIQRLSTSGSLAQEFSWLAGEVLDFWQKFGRVKNQFVQSTEEQWQEWSEWGRENSEHSGIHSKYGMEPRWCCANNLVLMPCIHIQDEAEEGVVLETREGESANSKKWIKRGKF